MLTPAPNVLLPADAPDARASCFTRDSINLLGSRQAPPEPRPNDMGFSVLQS